MHRYNMSRWGGAKDPASATHSNVPIGIAWGSGYQNRFLNMTSAQRTAALSKMTGAGIRWARVDCEWWTVQASNTPYDWSKVDTVVSALTGAGINVVLLLNTTPDWAKAAANSAPVYAPNPYVDPAKYAKFCADAVSHFAPMGVNVYELWNEPNLTTGASISGWSYQLVAGFASIAIAAYAAMKAANPACYVLGGTIATSSAFGTAGNARSCSWSAVTAGATTATISCAAASASEAPGFLSGTGWPTGTIVKSVSAGVSYTVAPPPWSTGGFPAISAGSGSLQVQNTQLAPDFFLQKVYDYAAGAKWCDALAIHPYTQPVLPSAQLSRFGGWGVIPTMRQTMIANGDGAKPMWLTEIGAPSGAYTATWSAAASTATSVTVTNSKAVANDLNYLFTASGFPAGCYVSSVSAGTSWTISPRTGMTLTSAVAAGATVTSITVSATSTALTIPQGTTLKIAPPVTSGNWIPDVQAVVTSGAVTTSTTGTTTIPVNSVTLTYPYAVGSPVLGSVGQTFGSAISAGTSAAVSLTAQGTPFAFGLVDEATQTAIVQEQLQAIVHGVPSVSSTPGSPTMPYAHGTPVFVYCWADSNAGSFGVERVDGTSKPILNMIKQWTQGQIY